MNFGKMGNMGNMLKQAQKMQAQMQRVQEELTHERVEGTSGGGMVVASVNGQSELVGLKISPEVINADDADILEDLILAAVAEASRKARDLMQSRMGALTGGMGLPF